MEHFQLLTKAPKVPQERLANAAEIQRNFIKLGWRIPNLVNDQNKELWIVEIGSVGVFIGYCDDLGHWIVESNDISPSYPFMVKTITEDDNETENKTSKDEIKSEATQQAQEIWEYDERFETKSFFITAQQYPFTDARNGSESGTW